MKRLLSAILGILVVLAAPVALVALQIGGVGRGFAAATATTLLFVAGWLLSEDSDNETVQSDTPGPG